ncbi:PKD domain-containing protein [Hymenobacter baengnokdamensis]|uniref:PKD domain-containing protein n=1 Tax=Hymenobacter baengnokdamensis TaxID=2615203 RepID=UPI0017811DDE|nr:PKD domain-containing protein [Hymenobacter baengnokdamensis]
MPPFGANDRDYWGFYNANGSSTLIPQLYVYPQLLGQATVVPAAPYRLYESPTYAGGGFTLPGADRRPAPNFKTALAGTLTGVSLPGGGKALLEYEAPRFYDPVAQESYPAGGVRIRAIRVQDGITGLETRREYGYQLANGSASGLLLRAPHFALALPASEATAQQQWTNATARCGDDLTTDPFETRAIGYQQVSEQLPGKGQVITTYLVPGSADETTAADGAAAGISWARAAMGVARQSRTVAPHGTTTCPSVAPLQASTDLYPFAPATNYDFRRGLPQSILYLAEPVGNAAGATVRQETFTYQYRNLAPTLPPVTGLVYEQLLSGPDNVYAYAKYPILTDFLYAVRQQTSLTPNASGTANQSLTQYNYNSRGWLAAQATRTSEGSYYRTRYKYLTDYPLTAQTSEARLLAMQQRIASGDWQSSGDVVETISEVVSPTSQVSFLGGTLNTFTTTSQPGPTRPYQTFRYQPATPLVRGISGSNDSIQVIVNAAGSSELHVPDGYKRTSTLLETTSHLQPLSTRTEAGRQVTAIHLGYANTLPVLQLANALASEVVFSDFESEKDYAFSASTSANQPLAASGPAARTGQAGMELPVNAFLSSRWPTSTAPAYRLSFWARRTSSSAGSLLLTFTSSTGGTLPATQPLAITSATGQWQLYELLINLGAASPTGLALQLLNNGSTALQVDDVLLLPATAVATSTTYDLTRGKTSETDGRGRTSFYDYNVLGSLVRVRDHNGAIVKQLDQVVAGRTPAIAPSFVVSGIQQDGSPLTFTANSACGTDLSYSWDFGDNTMTAFSSTPSAQHSFSAPTQEQVYQVKLLVRISGQSKTSTSYQFITVRPAPITITSCTNGVVAIDNCGAVANRLENTCGSSATNTSSTTFNVHIDIPGSYTYTWRSITPGTSTWQEMPGLTSSSITVLASGQSPASSSAQAKQLYQCTITNASGYVVGTSDVFSIEHYSSSGTQQIPCGIQ